jgi:cell division protein FtsL
MTHRDVRTRRVVAAFAIVVVLFVPLVSTLHAWYEQRQEIDAMRATIAAQEEHVGQLQKEQARWRDDAYVVQQARKRLKMVKVGETAYTVIDTEPATAKDPTLATAPAGGSHPWYGRLWESVEVADAPAAHP